MCFGRNLTFATILKCLKKFTESLPEKLLRVLGCVKQFLQMDRVRNVQTFKTGHNKVYWHRYEFDTKTGSVQWKLPEESTSKKLSNLKISSICSRLRTKWPYSQ